jgi:hypothetical protein
VGFVSFTKLSVEIAQVEPGIAVAGVSAEGAFEVVESAGGLIALGKGMGDADADGGEGETAIFEGFEQ